jgi:ubiquinone/menaquinone biosynthesis C-methylase UbiE
MVSTAEKIKVENVTGDLYSDCFARLNDDDSHWFPHSKLLAQQLGITAEKVRDKKCLDGGCGPGTLTYRLLELGAHHVTAVDLHPTPKKGVFDAYSGKVDFVTASLLDLPFEAEMFDVVASTGVLQHTADPERALSELIRVLKKGATLYLGVYGKHGLFSWALSLARIFTVRIPIIPKSLIDTLISLMGFGPLIRYQILDYLYVPNIIRSTPAMLEGWMKKYGMKKMRRIYAVTEDEATHFRQGGTVYTYDPRTLKNRILFGHGFINMQAEKE